MIGLRNQSVQHLHIETWRNNEGVELIPDSQLSVSLVGDDECVSLLGVRHAFKLSKLRVVVWFGSVN